MARTGAAALFLLTFWPGLTGGSSLQAVDAVEAMGCKVARVIVVLDRLEGAAEAFHARGLDFRALVTVRDLGVEPLPTKID